MSTKQTGAYIAHFAGGIPAVMGVEGTLGTSDTGGTARVLPIGVNPTTGAAYVQDLSGASGTTNVQIVGGTLNAGTVTTTLALDTGTITTIAAGTQNTLGTVGVVNNLVKGTVTSLEGGTLTALAVGTVGGKAASGAAAVANPVQIAGTDAGGTIYSPLVTSAGALTVTGASAGTVVEVNKGTINVLANGTISAGTVAVTVGSVVGPNASAGTSTTSPVQIGGTTSTGTVYGMLVDTAGNPQMDVVTLPSDGTVVRLTSAGTIAGFNTGTVTTGSLTNIAMLHGGTVNASIVSSNGTIIRVGHVGTIESMPAVGGGTQFAEDAAHTTGDGGQQVLAVRVDNGTSLVGADLDYAPLQVDANGALRIAGTVATGAGTQAVRLIDGTLTNLVSGTLNALAAGTITTGTVAVTVGSVVGPNASAGTSTTAPVQVGGTTSTGTVYGMLIDTAGNPQVDIVNTPSIGGGTIQVGTISKLPSDGTITQVTTVSALTNGSVVMTVGTMTTGSLSNLAMLHAGTIDSISNLVKGTITRLEGGTLGALAVGTITTGTVTVTTGTVLGPNASAGTSTTAPVQIGGTTSTGTVYGMLVDTAGNPQVDVVTLPSDGTIVRLTSAGTVAGFNTGTITTGSITDVAKIYGGTIQVGSVVVTSLPSGGTILNLATGTLAAVTTVTTVSNLTNGSVVMTGGTLTTGTLQNLVSGTINALAAGTITAGTVRTDTRPVGSVVQSTHVLGTGGGTFVGTLVAPTGAGTTLYLTGLSIVGRSGTADCGIANNVAGTTGAGVYARGAFNPGGGIARTFDPPIQIGTNGTLAYFIISAGTSDFTVNYIVST